MHNAINNNSSTIKCSLDKSFMANTVLCLYLIYPSTEMLTTSPPHTHFHDKRDIKHVPERNKSNGQAGPYYYNNNRCLFLFHYSKLSLICLGWINKSWDALLRFYRDRHTSYIDKL